MVEKKMMKITVEWPEEVKGEHFIDPFLIINYTVTVGGTMIQLTDGKILKIKESYSYVDEFVTQANLEVLKKARKQVGKMAKSQSRWNKVYQKQRNNQLMRAWNKSKKEATLVGKGCYKNILAKR